MSVISSFEAGNVSASSVEQKITFARITRDGKRAEAFKAWSSGLIALGALGAVWLMTGTKAGNIIFPVLVVLSLQRLLRKIGLKGLLSGTPAGPEASALADAISGPLGLGKIEVLLSSKNTNRVPRKFYNTLNAYSYADRPNKLVIGEGFTYLLSAEQAGFIFGHEVAHLTHRNPRLLWAYHLAELSGAVLAVAGVNAFLNMKSAPFAALMVLAGEVARSWSNGFWSRKAELAADKAGALLTSPQIAVDALTTLCVTIDAAKTACDYISRDRSLTLKDALEEVKRISSEFMDDPAWVKDKLDRQHKKTHLSSTHPSFKTRILQLESL